MNIRPALRTDLGRLTDIYNHYVINSHATFDVDPFTEPTRLPWFKQFDGKRYQCLVAELDGALAGYAGSAKLKEKPAYQSSVEVSVYLAPDATGGRIGTRLYRALLDHLAGQDVHRAYALIAQPNDASMRLHEAYGFRQVARLNEVGRKFDRYWDVVWLERAM
ncbi:MAG: GNAT family N-acetyltransferase [Gammaproteobacteria bacterium]